jgi:hypothetical protein
MIAGTIIQVRLIARIAVRQKACIDPGRPAKFAV